MDFPSVPFATFNSSKNFEYTLMVGSFIYFHGFRKLSFLANDVTLVTSYGYCQSLKINDIRETSVLRFVRLGDIL